MDDQQSQTGGYSDNSAFSGFTTPANSPGQDVSRTSKARLDELLNARRERPEAEWEVISPEPAAWEEMYYSLLEERIEVTKPDGTTKWTSRWDWRKALYIAWHCVPASKRWPKYEIQLIDLLGLTNTRTIRQWKAKDPEIEERIAAGPKKLLIGHIANVMEALVIVASQADPKAHQDRKLFLEMTGQYTGKLELSGEDGEPITTMQMTVDEWRAEQEKRQQQVAQTLADFDDDE